MFLIAITATASVTAMAAPLVKAGYVTISALGKNTTIGDVSKNYVQSYSSIFTQKGADDKDYTLRVWVKDTTKSSTLSSKVSITVTSTSVGHWIPYKSGVSYSVGDTIRFIGEQSGTSKKGLNYVIYGDKATL